MRARSLLLCVIAWTLATDLVAGPPIDGAPVVKPPARQHFVDSALPSTSSVPLPLGERPDYAIEERAGLIGGIAGAAVGAGGVLAMTATASKQDAAATDPVDVGVALGLGSLAGAFAGAIVGVFAGSAVGAITDASSRPPPAPPTEVGAWSTTGIPLPPMISRVATPRTAATTTDAATADAATTDAATTDAAATDAAATDEAATTSTATVATSMIVTLDDDSVTSLSRIATSRGASLAWLCAMTDASCARDVLSMFDAVPSEDAPRIDDALPALPALPAR
jgi:hypothetical protein